MIGPCRSMVRSETKRYLCVGVMAIVAVMALISFGSHDVAEVHRDGWWRMVAVTVVLRHTPDVRGPGIGGVRTYQVRTQTRHVLNKVYDPLYDGTHEAVGETVKSGESLVDAVLRGVAEEVGYVGGNVTVVGATGAITATHRTDPVFTALEPYQFVQQLGPPQPWAGLGFVALLPDDAELGAGYDEVRSAQWWQPAELLLKLQREPELFMGFHYPVLLKVCQDVASGALQPKLAQPA